MSSNAANAGGGGLRAARRRRIDEFRQLQQQRRRQVLEPALYEPHQQEQQQEQQPQQQPQTQQAMADEARPHDANVFVYTGEGGDEVPFDIQHVRVHPSVTSLPNDAFRGRNKLEMVELPEGLVTIGDHAFYCCKSLKRLTIPTTVRTIQNHAFHFTSLVSIHLPDGTERMGEWTFCSGEFLMFRVPPLITTFSLGLFGSCHRMFSLEIPESTRRIVYAASSMGCHSLRNVAIPPNATVERNSFLRCEDLHQLFGSSEEDRLTNALKRRFDGLPIHKLLYYQSYRNPVLTTDDIERAANRRSNQRRTLRSKLDPSGNQQDCLGMTPLHILACSTTVQNLELYRVLIEKYPQTLISRDRWGALPLLYAVWSDNVPSAILQFLVDRYLSIYPAHVFDWSGMVQTLAKANASPWKIQTLLDVRQASYPRQHILWDAVIDNLTNFEGCIYRDRRANPRSIRFLIERSISKRMEAIGPKRWRRAIAAEIESNSVSVYLPRKMTEVRSVLEYYEAEYCKLKEATSILELALWKAKINESKSIEGRRRRHAKKIRIDDSASRQRCRIGCGADHVIENVLMFLLPLGVGWGCDTKG